MLDFWPTPAARRFCAPSILFGSAPRPPGLADDFARLRAAASALVEPVLEANEDDLEAAFDEVIGSPRLREYENAQAAVASQGEMRDFKMPSTDPRRVKRRQVLGASADETIAKAEAMIGRIFECFLGAQRDQVTAPEPSEPLPVREDQPSTASVLRDPSVPLALRKVIYELIRGTVALLALEAVVERDDVLEPWRIDGLVSAYSVGADALGKLLSLADGGKLLKEEIFPQRKKLDIPAMREREEGVSRWVSELCDSEGSA